MKKIVLFLLLIANFSFSQWTKLTSSFSYDIYAVDFANEFVGYAAGHNGAILKTTDGGSSWNLLNSGTLNTLYCIQFFDQYTGIAAGYNGIIIQTTDGGNNWQSITSPTNETIIALSFDGLNSGFALAQFSSVYKRNNTQWDKIALPVPSNFFLTNISFSPQFTNIDKRFGIIVGDQGIILKSFDNGATWSVHNQFLTGTLLASAVVDTLNTFIGGTPIFIYKSSDKGNNWQSQTKPGYHLISNFSFITDQIGMASCYDGFIYETTNNGGNWIETSLGALNFYDIDYVTKNCAFAVGGSGSIYKYSNGTQSATITVTAPNGGENVTVGSTATINWTSSNVSNVKIEYTTNNGSTWLTIISSYPASLGSYMVTISNTPSTQCKIKISDASNASINDMSDNVFTISTGTSSGGLIAYYPFNGNANDESGNGRNGVNYGATLTTDRFGNPDKAYQFNGTSDYIDIPGTNNLHLNSGGLTLAAWINFTESNEIHAIVSKHIAGYGNGYYIMVRPATKIEFLVDSEYGLRSNDSYNDGAWHFVVGTFDGSMMKIYIDGELKSSQTKTYSSLNDSTITIGKHHAGVATDFFNGKIDEIRLFDKAISEAEVLQLFNDGINLNQGLVAHYPFNGNANDESGNNRNGINYGSTLTTDRFGNANSAYTFNGTSNYIDIPGTNNLHLNSGGFTLAAWINFTESNEMHAIIGKHISGYGNGYYLMIRPATNVEFYTDSEYGLRSSDAINDGNWHFLAGVYNGLTMKLYVDGMMKATQPKSYTNLNDSTLMIGKHHTGAAADFFNGKIDDISIYNRPLTDLEILALNNENPVRIKDEKSKTPNSFSLEQNYPNPFNPNTKISYTVPNESHVKLSVFNLLGELVSMPVNEIKQTGNYTIDFNAGNLNSGIYFYRIETSGFIQAKKMILLK